MFNITPTLRALVLADHIYTDMGTRKRVIAGTFNRVFVDCFPADFGRPIWAFLLLSDCQGTGDVQLKFVHLSDNEVLAQSPIIQIQSQDRFATYDIAMEIPSLQLPKEGVYCFECYADERLIGSARLQVARKEADPGEIDDDQDTTISDGS